MLHKSREIVDSIVMSINKIEHALVASVPVTHDQIAALLGRHEGFVAIYNYIQKNAHNGDEFDLEQTIMFCKVEFKKVRDVAFDTKLSLDFPRDKQLAFGKLFAYKDVEQKLTEILTSKLEAQDGEEG